MMVTVYLDSPSCEVTLFDPVSVVYWDATRQTKGLYRLKYVGALWSGLACLSRYNSGWFCHSYPLVVDPMIGNKHLTKVLMDEGSSLKIKYVETLDAMGISRSKLLASIFPFLGIIPSMREYPLGNIDLPVTFGDHSNFRTKTLIFEVVDFEGSYHAILGCPCYTKFMAVPTPTSS
jgi:hypothetical protein